MIANLRGRAYIANKYFLYILSDGCHHKKEGECECMCMKVLLIPRCKPHKITSSQNSRSRKQDQEKDKT